MKEGFSTGDYYCDAISTAIESGYINANSSDKLQPYTVNNGEKLEEVETHFADTSPYGIIKFETLCLKKTALVLIITLILILIVLFFV
jgi:hypothetical protein